MTTNTGQSVRKGSRDEALLHAHPSTQMLRITSVELNNIPFSTPLCFVIRFDLHCVTGRRFTGTSKINLFAQISIGLRALVSVREITRDWCLGSV